MNNDDVSVMDTRTFLSGMKKGQEINIELEHGKTLFIKFLALSDIDSDGYRKVIFELNGQRRIINVEDKQSGIAKVTREKANLSKIGSVGASMPGAVIDVKVKEGQNVQKGEPLCVLSAMKMETVVAAPCSGKINKVAVVVGDSLQAGDLIIDIE